MSNKLKFKLTLEKRISYRVIVQIIIGITENLINELNTYEKKELFPEISATNSSCKVERNESNEKKLFMKVKLKGIINISHKFLLFIF